MTPLVLVRHARTEVDPRTASRDWPLAAGAEVASRRLAELVADDVGGDGIDRVVTSREAKAVATGTIMAQVWSVPCSSADDLHEHERAGVPVMAEQAWQAVLKRLFDEPENTVLGRESAVAAVARFERGLRRVLTRHPQEGLAVVSHGTVLALFVAKHNALDGYRLWQTLAMPEALLIERKAFRLMGRRAL